MEKKILNNKIGIQILFIIAGVVLFVFGVLCSLFQSGNFDGAGSGQYGDYVFQYHFDGFVNFDTFCIFIGMAISFVGLILFIASSIKLANLVLIKKSTNIDSANAKSNAAVDIENQVEHSDKSNEHIDKP